MVSMEIFVDLILPSALVPWGDSASNRNWYQGYFLGGKDGRDVGLTTLSLLHADCLKIWEQQPPGVPWACPVPYGDYFTFCQML